jgi:zinc D-Ala-D-Ala carboxypeptidase
MSHFFTPQTDPHLFRCPCNRPECDAPKPTEDLLAMLELLRALVNRPIIVTSGPRCEPYNTSIGGALDSAHLTGQAADLSAPTSYQMDELLEGSFRAGIARRGVYKNGHLHVDVALGKPQHVTWVQ